MKGLITRKSSIWFMPYIYTFAFRKASNALIVAIWLWIQKFANLNLKQISCILIDETQIGLGLARF
jgi:hypothetical protein